METIQEQIVNLINEINQLKATNPNSPQLVILNNRLLELNTKQLISTNTKPNTKQLLKG